MVYLAHYLTFIIDRNRSTYVYDFGLSDVSLPTTLVHEVIVTLNYAIFEQIALIKCRKFK